MECWEHLVLRHNLGVTHIKKNVCDSLLGIFLNIQEKTKDGIETRLDLIEMDVRKELAPKVSKKQTYLPPACFTLTKEGKHILCQYLFDVKVPDRYSL